jgi:HEPN domain-containing protein
MIIKVTSFGPISPGTISARCPGCRQLGTFDVLGQDLLVGAGTVVGHRSCPNPECKTHMFIVRQNNSLAASYPPVRIDFDTTNVPAAVVASFEEAIACHANCCFVAAAIMVRKTLEELCRDRGSAGKDLRDRVKDLGTKVVLPKELLEGLDDLRLLGNDAAHIESREYDKVGKEEVEVGIEFAKEVLKAVYQYSALLGRLRGLKKGP